MENIFDLEDSAGYRHLKAVDYIKRFPLDCQPLMKNYFQCMETYKGSRREVEALNEHKAGCLEKYAYTECVTENFSKVRDPRIRRTNVRIIEGDFD